VPLVGALIFAARIPCADIGVRSRCLSSIPAGQGRSACAPLSWLRPVRRDRARAPHTRPPTLWSSITSP